LQDLFGVVLVFGAALAITFVNRREAAHYTDAARLCIIRMQQILA
jgi:hypothetical protein